MNKRELNKYEKMLLAERDKIIKAAKAQTAEELHTNTDDLYDEIDQASSEFSQSLAYRFRDRERNLLKKVEKALDKIKDRTYGICESCEEEIEPKRLQARPVTDYCISCKEQMEKLEA